ncbi:MAG: protein kinase, partial [Planctomycetia bacterium]|nr:protein kinase [Planctomycetia bacterium]
MSTSKVAGEATCLSAADLAAVVNDTLPPNELTRIEAHLQACVPCRTAVDSQRHSISETQNLPPAHHAATIDAPSPIGQDATIGSTTTVEEMSARLVRSGLVSQDELESIVSASFSPETQLSSGDQLAQTLLERKRITGFQLDRLREGKVEGLVLGNYVLLDKLGAGGMGVVYKALHRRMKREVALKVLPEALTKAPDAVARFHREVEAAARLQHPNIAAAYDADEAAGVHFFVLEFVDGPDLSRYIKQNGPLPLAHALALCLQAARGLAHAHKLGVVHRDIKPGNLLVDPNGTLKILDMGLAHLHTEQDAAGVDLTELTQSGRVMGTVDYMAPEQAVDAKRADHRADIYSLGCTLHYLVTARPLSPEGSLTQKLLWHQTETIAPLSSVCPASTPGIDAALALMLAKRPQDRPQSMVEVIRLLEPCLAEVTADGKNLPAPLKGALAMVDVAPSMYSGSITERPTVTETQTMTMVAPATTGAGQPPRRRVWIAAGFAGFLGVGALSAVIAMRYAGQQPQRAVAGNKNDPNPMVSNPAVPNPSGPNPAAPVVAERPEDKSLDRVFDLGGSVTVATSDGLAPRSIGRRGDLPAPPFEVRSVKLDRAAVDGAVLGSLEKLPGLQSILLPGATVADDDLASLTGPATLVSLDLSRTSVGDRGAAPLARLTSLLELNLSGTKITSTGVRELGGLKRLEKVYLANTPVDDSAIESLRSLTDLKYLVLSGSKITADGFDKLVTARPNIEVVWDGPDTERVVARKLLEKGGGVRVQPLGGIAAGAQADAEIRRTVDLPSGRFQVVEADLSGNPGVGDADLKFVATLRHLARLKLDGTSVTAEGLQALRTMPGLQKLDLGTLQIPQSTLTQLAQALPQCEIHRNPTSERATAQWVLQTGGTLTLSTPEGEVLRDISDAALLPQGPFVVREAVLAGKPQVTDADLAKFRGLAQLELLNLSGTSVTDAGLDQLAGCTSLRDLDLSQTKITAAAAPSLARLRTLKQLYLSGTTINGVALRQLLLLTKLTHLGLAHAGIGNGDLANLRGFGQLTWLSLSGDKIDDAAVEQLRELKKLRELNLIDSGITDAGLEDLRLALPNCKVLGNEPDPQRLAARWALEHGGAVSIQNGDAVQQVERLAQLPRGACRLIGIDLSRAQDVGEDDLKPLRNCRGIT